MYLFHAFFDWPPLPDIFYSHFSQYAHLPCQPTPPPALCSAAAQHDWENNHRFRSHLAAKHWSLIFMFPESVSVVFLHLVVFSWMPFCCHLHGHSVPFIFVFSTPTIIKLSTDIFGVLIKCGAGFNCHTDGRSWLVQKGNFSITCLRDWSMGYWSGNPCISCHRRKDIPGYIWGGFCSRSSRRRFVASVVFRSDRHRSSSMLRDLFALGWHHRGRRRGLWLMRIGRWRGWFSSY